MNSCLWVNEHINDYLDGTLTGLQMQQITQHIGHCKNCCAEFDSLRETQSVLAQLGPHPVPANLGLRLRVALSHELARAREPRMEKIKMAWENTLAPLLLQASAGLASTVLLLGTVGFAVGMFTHPQKLSAQDEPLGMATPPHFLYASAGSDENRFGAADDPLVIMAMVNDSGRVYDYRILSGTLDADAKSKLESLMLLSLFEPARRFGEPVRGVVILSFAGVAVKG
jgi:hypothetical protein